MANKKLHNIKNLTQRYKELGFDELIEDESNFKEITKIMSKLLKSGQIHPKHTLTDDDFITPIELDGTYMPPNKKDIADKQIKKLVILF